MPLIFIYKLCIHGTPGWLSEHLPLAQLIIPRSWDWVPHRVPCMEPASSSACVSASLSLSLSVSLMNKYSLKQLLVENFYVGAPGWLSWLSIFLQLRSWSRGPGIEPHVGLPAEEGAGLSSPSLGLSPPLVPSLFQINKIFKKKKAQAAQIRFLGTVVLRCGLC